MTDHRSPSAPLSAPASGKVIERVGGNADTDRDLLRSSHEHKLLTSIGVSTGAADLVANRIRSNGYTIAHPAPPSDKVLVSREELEQMTSRIADHVIVDVADLPDRTSPDGQPDMMLVTGEELYAIVESAIEYALAALRSELEGGE